MGAGKYAIVLLVLSAVFANSLPMEAVDVRLADQFLEMLAQGIEPPEDTPDPVAFARRLGFDPDPWQAEMLRSDASRVLLNCSRQSGKSTTTAVLALYTPLSFAPAKKTTLVHGQAAPAAVC